jgi:hypothetical protein
VRERGWEWKLSVSNLSQRRAEGIIGDDAFQRAEEELDSVELSLRQLQ